MINSVEQSNFNNTYLQAVLIGKPICLFNKISFLQFIKFKY